MTGAGERKDTEVKKSEVDFMDIKILDTKENQVKFLVKGTNPAFANALRRTMMAGLNILAVEDVHFYQNTSVMFDEMLAHRLAMIPLKMDSKKYKAGEKVKLVLEKEGPCTVYSKDIKSTDPTIEPAFGNIPITELAEGQSLKLEMDAIAGRGTTHSKYQPAIVSYTEMPSIVDKSGKKSAYKADLLEMILDEKKRDIIVKDNEKIEYDSTAFIFTVESHGNLEPKELIIAAVEELTEKSKEFRQELKNLS